MPHPLTVAGSVSPVYEHGMMIVLALRTYVVGHGGIAACAASTHERSESFRMTVTHGKTIARRAITAARSIGTAGRAAGFFVRELRGER